jgi:hypothetical protein
MEDNDGDSGGVLKLLNLSQFPIRYIPLVSALGGSFWCQGGYPDWASGVGVVHSSSPWK